MSSRGVGGRNKVAKLQSLVLVVVVAHSRISLAARQGDLQPLRLTCPSFDIVTSRHENALHPVPVYSSPSQLLQLHGFRGQTRDATIADSNTP